LDAKQSKRVVQVLQSNHYSEHSNGLSWAQNIQGARRTANTSN
jgi:hypothetical protein